VREMLLSVYGASMVGDDGGRGATVWRDTGTCYPSGTGCSARAAGSTCNHAHVDAYASSASAATTTSAAYSNRSAVEQQQRFEWRDWWAGERAFEYRGYGCRPDRRSAQPTVRGPRS
jgi:hypothetical protein